MNLKDIKYINVICNLIFLGIQRYLYEEYEAIHEKQYKKVKDKLETLRHNEFKNYTKN